MKAGNTIVLEAVTPRARNFSNERKIGGSFSLSIDASWQFY
jgi:hypothetical protein